MVFTEEQIEAIKTAALPLDYGSITIQICANTHYIDIEICNRVRISKDKADNKSQKNVSVRA